MKIPEWVGKVYSRLYSELRSGEFTFEEAADIVGVGGQRLRTLLSAMKRSGLLEVLGRRGYKRVYRVADPAEVTLLSGKGIDLGCLPEHVRAVVRSYLRGVFEKFHGRIISVVLYGSFARGDYGPESDVDLLFVIEGYERSEGLGVKEADELTYKIWKLRGEYHKVLPYPLTPEQARYHRPLYLDMTEDSILLYDEDGFMKGVLDEVRSRLRRSGAERRELLNGSWYWVLKPDVKPGEVVEI
ncbi:MAG: nucleotidyltransferase domain-containing protein [Candidatus Hadarchaeota archaeon]|nr:nucleotidyltransferase domain-containing protein [Candidatus Hadarchaeota archaeon]